MSKKKFDPLAMAFPIIREFNIYCLSAGKKPQLICYRSGKYVIGDRRIEVHAQTQCMKEGIDPIKDHNITEIVKAVRRNADVMPPEQLNNPKHQIIVFKNGVLDLRTMKLQKHSPNYKYTINIPHNFNPDASCPKFDKFIAKVLPEKVSFDPATFTAPVSFDPSTFTDDDGELWTSNSHLLIKQMMGYLMIPSTAFRKFFVLLGEGANGKSTLIEVIVEMLGRENVSHQSLHDLAQRNFSKAELFGKLANTCADLESKDVKDSGLLKQIVAGDSMQYEKKFLDPFSGPATARLLFSANKMPPIHDTSQAMADRPVLIDFPVRIEEDDQDKTLIHKLTTEDEIEGIIVRYAIPGLQALLRAGKFNIPHKSLQLLEEYRRRCDLLPYDHFTEFIDGCADEVESGFVTKVDFYRAYESWCKANSHSPFSLKEFNQRVCERFNIPRHSEYRAPGTRDRAWPGIKLNLPSGEGVKC